MSSMNTHCCILIHEPSLLAAYALAEIKSETKYLKEAIGYAMHEYRISDEVDKYDTHRDRYIRSVRFREMLMN